MQIRMITTAAGPDGVWPAGTEQSVEDAIGIALVDGGYATKIEIAIALPEMITADAPTQAKPKPRRRATK